MELRLGLWPKGTISGALKVKDKSLALPRTILVKTLEVPAFLKRPPVPPGVLECPVDKQGSWSCSLPRATFDLVITAEGFTPQYRWNVEVAAGKALSLGTIALERGASVAGWVSVEGGAIEMERCIARLAPLLAAGTDLRQAADLERTAIEAPVRKDGFFQLAGPSPGNYTLEIRQPDYAPVRVSPVRIDPGAETFLRDPIVLARPLALSFAVTPPLDRRGRRWNARVLRAREAGARLAPVVFEGAVDAEGRFTVAGQAAGDFSVSVSDSTGNPVYFAESWHIEGPVSAPLPIDIEVLEVKGRLFLGKEPLPGVLWFGGKNGATSMKMEADSEGNFAGVVSRRDGPWPVEIEGSRPELHAWKLVEVHADRSGEAELEIMLSDTRLFGRVVDEEGQPVPVAQVELEGKDLFQHLETDRAGDFEVRGLQEGALKVEAFTSARSSEPVIVSVVEGRAAGPLEIRLRKSEKLAGTVLSSRGPVAGARVVVAPFPATSGGGTGTTGVDGAFSVNVLAGVHQVMALVSAPGFAFRVFGPIDPAALHLMMPDDEGGDLEVILPGKGSDLQHSDLSLALFQNGLPLPLGLLRQWAFQQGVPRTDDTTFRFPKLAPGPYSACLLPRELEWTGAAGESVGAQCDSGLLTSGAKLSLKLSGGHH